MGDKSIALWANYIGTKVLLGREYARKLNFFSQAYFAGLNFFNEPEISDSGLMA